MDKFKLSILSRFWQNIKAKITASMVKFSDGETFQEKYDKGELKGQPGSNGSTGPTGPSGKDGLGIYRSSASTSTSTTSISISTITIPSDRNIQEGDFIIANSTYSYLYRVTSVNSTTATVTYITSLRGATGSKGTTGDAGKDGSPGEEGIGIFAQKAPSISYKPIYPTDLEIPSGRTLKAGTLIIYDGQLLYNESDVKDTSKSIITKVLMNLGDSIFVPATDEQNAITLSTQNPDKFYYLTETEDE